MLVCPVSRAPTGTRSLGATDMRVWGARLSASAATAGAPDEQAGAPDPAFN